MVRRSLQVTNINLDAEKALAEAKRKAKTSEDKHVAEVLNRWLYYLTVNREMGGPTKNAISMGFFESATVPCWAEARWYFGTIATEKGIEMAKKSTCAVGEVKDWLASSLCEPSALIAVDGICPASCRATSGACYVGIRAHKNPRAANRSPGSRPGKYWFFQESGVMAWLQRQREERHVD